VQEERITAEIWSARKATGTGQEVLGEPRVSGDAERCLEAKCLPHHWGCIKTFSDVD